MILLKMMTKHVLLSIFYNISNGLAPSYLSDHIPKRSLIGMSLRNRSDSPPLTRTNKYENSFFPYTIKAWKELDEKVKSKPSIQSFNKSLFDFKRPLGHTPFGICEKFGIRLLTKIRV